MGEKAISSSDTGRHQRKFIRHCMRLWSVTLLDMALQKFIVGHYGGFDRLAASTIKEARRFYPEVRLLCYYHTIQQNGPSQRQIDLTEHFIRLEWRVFHARLQS